MSKKFLTHIDLSKNELQNAVHQNLGTAPGTPVKGLIYFNSTDNTLYWWDGTAWVSARGGGTGFPGFGPVVQEQLFGSTKVDGSAATAARSDHMHGNPVHDAITHSGIPLNILAQPTGVVNMGGQRITNMADPTAATDASTKQYVDNLVTGLAWSDTVRAATTANITLSGTQAIDGVTLAVNDRVLVKDQTTQNANGVYIVQSGAWTRATDADSEAELLNMAVWVSEGTTQADTAWVMTANAPITVGTTNLTWVQFAGSGTVAAGAGLTRTGNTIDVGAGTGITVAADTVGLDTAFTDTRYVNTSGDTMTGQLTLPGTPGGANDAVSQNQVTTMITAAAVPPQRTVTAGAGLTGGGDLSANRTFDIGAGTGITVAADAISFDTAFGDGRYALATATIKRFQTNVGGATSQVIAHNLATRDVLVALYRNSTPWDEVECDVERTDANNLTLRFTVAPAAAEYRVVVLA